MCVKQPQPSSRSVPGHAAQSENSSQGNLGIVGILRTPERASGHNSEKSVHAEMTGEGSVARGNSEN